MACSYCSRVDQPITLANLETIPAGEVKAGDRLRGWADGRWQDAIVLEVFQREAEVVEITTADGKQVVVTPDHHWFDGQTYKPVSIGESLLVPSSEAEFAYDKQQVISIRSLGVDRVASFTTSTHNYISGGFLSRNCFANLNSPSRTANVPQIMGLLSNHQEKSTYAARLLHSGYPTVISNHVDPFADSNSQVALPILEAMTELGLPYSIQTKCGKAGYEAMKFMPPIVYYISIATMDEEVLQRVEPGAPTAIERFRFIEHARSLGHRICVGINPCVQEWIGDPTALCRTLASLGVEGIWVQPLHLSNRQIANMSDREKAAMGETVLNKARQFRREPTMREAYLKTRYAAESHGMEVYDASQRERSDYFKPYKQTYAKTFPVAQDFVNWCYDKGLGENDPIYFETWRDFFLPNLPTGTFALRNHIAAVQYSHFWKGERSQQIPQYMTYEKLLEIIWADHGILYHPCHINCFALAGDRNAEGRYALHLDSNGRYILLFRPNGCTDRAVQWEMW